VLKVNSFYRRVASQTFPRRAGKTVRAASDDFPLDRESRNFGPKTLVQHRTALAHLANFLETQHKVTHLSMIEAVHLQAWLVFLAKEQDVRASPAFLARLVLQMRRHWQWRQTAKKSGSSGKEKWKRTVVTILPPAHTLLKRKCNSIA
jgi:hypothetical protein